MFRAMTSFLGRTWIRATTPLDYQAPRTFGWLLWLLSLCGWGAAIWVLLAARYPQVVNGVASDAGGTLTYGWDSVAYWLAGLHLRTGTPIYFNDQATQNAVGAFFYPPLVLPLCYLYSLIPLQVALVLSHFWEIGALRVLTGSWRTTGIWLLWLPPMLIDIKYGQVILLTAAGVSLALRGRTGWLGLAAAPKFAPGLAVPAAWRLYPGQRRSLVLGLAGVGLIGIISYVLAPGLWSDWLASLHALQQYSAAGLAFSNDWDGSFPFRLALAVILALLPFWHRWPFPRSGAYLAAIIGLTALRLISWTALAGLPLLFALDMADLDRARRTAGESLSAIPGDMILPA
jgi:hypothetical protein